MGTIPDHIRADISVEKIKRDYDHAVAPVRSGIFGTIAPEYRTAYKGTEFDGLYLLREGDFTLQVNELPPAERTVNYDPLLIGRRGRHYYVLDLFDLTPAEDYIRREFTTKEP